MNDPNTQLSDLLAQSLAPVPAAADPVHEMEEAIRVQDRRARLSDLTDGPLDDHALALTELAARVRRLDVGVETPDQIADAIEVARNDLQTARDEAAQ